MHVPPQPLSPARGNPSKKGSYAFHTIDGRSSRTVYPGSTLDIILFTFSTQVCTQDHASTEPLCGVDRSFSGAVYFGSYWELICPSLEYL
ncbi:hypothetical protein BaRGS_00039059 [Batillaria attramentaria]|uniref:Uncharacterized protein n=1 Tax=Batillaria attramentaria TaxID=370345 RepID=A0ABD0J429_9CAEN